MKPNNVLFSVVFAAVLAAATAAGTSYLFLRYVPLGAASADQERVERIMRDYLINNPEILVEKENKRERFLGTAELSRLGEALREAEQEKTLSPYAKF